MAVIEWIQGVLGRREALDRVMEGGDRADRTNVVDRSREFEVRR